MDEKLDLVDVLDKVATALSGSNDRMDIFNKCLIDLIKVCQSMNDDLMKQQKAIIITHNMLCDILEKKHD